MFGANLKKYRVARGLSQSELADRLFVTRQCVSKWEKDITQPDLQTLSRIGEILGVSIDDLINDSPSVHNNKSNLNAALFIANILIAFFCTLFFLALWQFVPSTIPAHWSNGVVDRYGSRNELLLHVVTVVVFFIVDIIIFFVFRRVDGKMVLYISHLAIVLFQIGYLIFIIAMYARYINNIVSFTTCTCAALMACVSVAMHPKINKRNYLFGVRTADTLKSPEVWNKTNALACYLFSISSLIIFVINLIIEIRLAYLFFLIYIVLTVVVIVYAKIIKRREE